MSEKRKVGKRIIGAGMLLMMVMLVIATVAFAEDAAGHGNSSYSCSFLLGKQFEVLVADHNPDGSDRTTAEKEAARAKAEEKAKAGQYRFRVQAVLQCGEELWTEEKTVTLPLTGDAAVDGAGVEQADGDRWTAKITFKGAKSAYLTAAEVMEGNTVGSDWYQKAPNLDVSRPAEENGVRGDRSTASYLSISKNGGHIRIEKPMNKSSRQENLYAYRLTGYAKEEGDPLPEGGKTVRLVIWPPAAEGSASLSPEEEKDIQVADWGAGIGFAVKSEGAVDITGLPAGTYKLEELSADGGFTFVVENPSVTMSAVPAVDGTGMALGRNNRVNINGLGEVTFNAPHDGKSHRYIVTKNGDANFREEITVPPNGFVRQNIQQGSYTIRENVAQSEPGFVLLAPKFIVGFRSYNSTLTGNKTVTPTTEIIPENGDCARIGVSAVTGIAAGNKVSFRIGGLWNGETSKRTRNVSMTVYANADQQAVMNPPYLVSQSYTIRTSNTNVKSYKTNYKILKFQEFPSEADRSGIHSQTVKVNNADFNNKANTGELVVRKPADTSGSPVADQIDYYFTVTGPDGYEESLILHAGEEKRLTGLVPGEYTVTETKVDNPGGKDFVVNIKDAPYTSHTGESLTAYLRQGGSILLEKPARSAEERPDDAAWGKRKYFFAVDRVDLDHPDGEGKPTVLGTVTEFTLTPGESLLLSATGAAPAAAEATRVIEVPPDSYTIRPIGDENSGFRMLYGSSNTLAVIGEFNTGESKARAADEDAPAENKELVKLISTNRLTEEAAGYRIIHEYYESEEDLGNKELAEDSTRMESIRGEAADTVHTAAEVDRLEQAPNGKFYRYVEYDYGRLQEKSTQQPRMTFRDTGPAPEVQSSAPAGARVTDSGPAPQKAAPAGDGTTNWIEIGGGNYTYHPEDALTDGVQSTLSGEQVIILRYVRDPSLDPPTHGGYRVVHRYYLRDESGDHYEGDTDRELREGLPIDKTYTAAEVGEKRTFTAEEGDEIGKEHQYRLDWIEYGTVNADGTYRRDTAMKHVTARADNSEMIVLCYVRELPPKPEEPKPDDPDPGSPDPNDPDKPDNPDEPEPEDPTPEEPAEEDPEPDPAPEPAPDDDDDDDDDPPPPPPAPKPPVSPDTGDGSRTGLWMLLSAGFLTALGLLRRRRR